MISVLAVYDPFAERSVPDITDEAASTQCRFLGSDLMHALGYESEERFKEAVASAMRACAALGLPLHHHFQPLFRGENSGLIRDYKLSALGCYFITINAEPALPPVARAQLFFLTHMRA